MNERNKLEMPGDRTCPFCAYLGGDRPYTVLWREEQIAVLVTREQRGVSHLLVMPLHHTPSLLEMSDVVARDLMLALRDAAETISAANNSAGISVWQNNGLPADQKIGHLHFHVAGTLPQGGTNFGAVPEIGVEETNRIAANLATHVIPRQGRHLGQEHDGLVFSNAHIGGPRESRC